SFITEIDPANMQSRLVLWILSVLIICQETNSHHLGELGQREVRSENEDYQDLPLSTEEDPTSEEKRIIVQTVKKIEDKQIFLAAN
ncbi:unnamed protein product, partial [Allacma fusca]